MGSKNVLIGNNLIAKFDGWTYIPDAKYENDLYENGDKAGCWETTDIYVKNPSKEFLKQKKFGSFASEDYYDDKEPYSDYRWSLNYDKDWNLLMPIVEKIEKLGHDCVMGFNNYCGFRHKNLKNDKGNTLTFESTHVVIEPNKIYTWQASSKIEGIYIAVIKFIKWYNENK